MGLASCHFSERSAIDRAGKGRAWTRDVRNDPLGRAGAGSAVVDARCTDVCVFAAAAKNFPLSSQTG